MPNSWRLLWSSCWAELALSIRPTTGTRRLSHNPLSATAPPREDNLRVVIRLVDRRINTVFVVGRLRPVPPTPLGEDSTTPGEHSGVP